MTEAVLYDAELRHERIKSIKINSQVVLIWLLFKNWAWILCKVSEPFQPSSPSIKTHRSWIVEKIPSATSRFSFNWFRHHYSWSSTVVLAAHFLFMTKIRFIIDILSLKVRNLQHLRYLTLLVLLQKIVKSFLQWRLSTSSDTPKEFSY